VLILKLKPYYRKTSQKKKAGLVAQLLRELYLLNFMKFILGKKIKMSQVFTDDGTVIPVTLIEAGPCFVLNIKNKEKDRYEAVQVGYDKIEKNKKKKPEYRYIKEFRTKNSEELSSYKIGQEINASQFQKGEKVQITGISKGKGFQGGVKRWGFSGRNSTHGTKHENRTLGSVGASMPPRVMPGKKMPGRTGSERITIRNLEVIKIEPEKNLIAIKGAIPGRKGTLIEIVNKNS